MEQYLKMRANISESLCTYILVFCGTGAIVIDPETNGDFIHLGMCITLGLIVISLIHCFRQISGAQMNPFRSLGTKILSGKLSSLCLHLTGPPTRNWCHSYNMEICIKRKIKKIWKII